MQSNSADYMNCGTGPHCPSELKWFQQGSLMVNPSVAHTTSSQDHISQIPEAHPPSTQSTGDSSSNTQMAKVNSISPMKGTTVNYNLNYGWSPTGTSYQNKICTPVMTTVLFRAFVIFRDCLYLKLFTYTDISDLT